VAWSGGIAEWDEGETTFISVVFTWKLQDAYMRAGFAKARGQHVRVGGPAVFLKRCREMFDGIAEIGGEYPDAVAKHNPDATVASRGCPVGCWFCIVPAMEGRTFTMLPDFPVRPVLCDNNLSGLPANYQDHIIRRYHDEAVPLRDANSGFEPITFTPDVYARWAPLVNAGKGPWRFAYDERKEGADARRVMDMLRDEPQKRKRVYVLIGNEPFADCMTRIEEVIAHGCEPHVQPFIKLNSMERQPDPRHDWSVQLLRDVARWANGWVWKKAPFSEYRRSHKSTAAPERYDEQQGLFV